MSAILAITSILLAAAAVAVYALPQLRTKRRRPAFRLPRLAQLQAGRARDAGDSGDGPRFIGRTEELKKLFSLAKQLEQGAQIVLVSGPPGSGRGTLLDEFRNRAALEVPALLTARPINLGQRRELNAILAELVMNLRDLGIGGFGAFERRQREYDAKRKGQPSPTGSTVRAARDVVSAGAVLAPGGAALSPLLKPVLDRTAEFVEGRLTGSGELDAVIEAFVDEFRRAFAAIRQGSADTRGAGSTAISLLFENLDSRNSSETVQELVTKVLKPLAGSPLLVVGTAERSEKLRTVLQDGFAGRVEEIPLDFFDEKDTRAFAQMMGLTRPEAIAQVYTITKGSPQRLAVLRTYYRANAEARSLPSIPTDALRLAASEEAAALASTLPSEFLANLARAASALRWFNAVLLEETATAAGLQPGADDKARPADLLRRGVGPLWIARAERGWTFDRPERRDSMLQEMREYYPTVFMQVSLAAATYHRRQIDQHEGTPVPEPDATQAPPARLDWLLSYRSDWPPQRRFSDADYVASLREWLYHCLAAEPSRAFGKLMDHVAEAMFEDRTDVGLQLLDIGAEVRLAAAERRRIDLLRDVMRSLQQEKYEDLRQQLRQLDQFWAHSTIMKTVETLNRGICEFNLNRRPDALTWFEQNQRRLEAMVQPDGNGRIDRLAARIFCLNATWLAYSHPETDAQIAKLDKAVEVARGADEKEMLAELHRVRGLIYLDNRQTDDAIREFESALATLDQFADLSSRLLVKRYLSSAYRAAERFDDAERELEEADSIVHVVQAVSERERDANPARIKLERLRLELDRGQAAAVTRLTQELIAESKNDEIVNDAGLALFEKDDWSTADQAFARAIELNPKNAVYHHNHATALAQLQRRKEALAALATCKALGGEYEIAAWVQSWLLSSVSVLEEQAAILEEALGVFPDDADLGFKRFEVLWEIESDKGAAPPDAADTANVTPRAQALPDRKPLIEILEQLQRAAPANSEFQLRRAEIALDEQDFALARRLADEARRRDGDQTRARRILDRARYARSLQREVDDSWSSTALPVLIQISPELESWMDNESPAGVEFFQSMIPALREDILGETGVQLPGVRVQSVADFGFERRVVIAINEAPRTELIIEEDYLVDAATLTDVRPGFLHTVLPWCTEREAYWLSEDELAALAVPPTRAWDPRGVIVETLAAVVRKYADELVTSELTSGWLDEGTLQPDHVIGPRLSAAARRLLREGVSLRGLPEALSNGAEPPTASSEALQDWLRVQLT